MPAFFAMNWVSTDALSDCEARLVSSRIGVSASVEADGFAFYDLSATAIMARTIPIMRDGVIQGVLFGQIFRNLEPGLDPTFSGLSSDDVHAIQRSMGESLISEFWGSYVGFVKRERELAVIADPTSAIPCFYMRRRGVTFVFSHLEKCTFLDRSTFRINYQFISQLLAYDKIQNGQTGIEGVTELMGGERLLVSGEQFKTTLLWDPRKIANPPGEPDPAASAETLRSTIRQVVGLRATTCSEILLNLSGGLDSAIVAAFLPKESRANRIRAVHISLRGGDLSEIEYARTVANYVGIELKELVLRPEDPLPMPHEHPLSVRPYREFLGRDVLRGMAELSETTPSAVFTGQGGDHLFLETSTPLGFADWLRRRGPFARETGVRLLEAARLSERSVWAVMREGATTWVSTKYEGSTAEAIRSRMTCVNRKSHSGLTPSDLLPVWASKAESLPPAKFDQVSSLVHLMQVRKALDLSASQPVVHPLVSQPLVELCLRLPVYLLCKGGRSRGLAREAVSGLIPDNVRTRRSKGGATRFYVKQLAANRRQIAEALMDGELVARGLIDRSDVEAFLNEQVFMVDTFGRMMIVYYGIEAWLSRWTIELATGRAAASAKSPDSRLPNQ